MEEQPKFSRIDKHFFNNKVSEEERDALRKKFNNEEIQKTANGDLTLEQAMKDTEQRYRDLMGKSKAEALKQASAIVNDINAVLDKRMNECAEKYKSLESHISKEVLDNDARDEQSMPFRQLSDQLTKEMHEVLSYMEEHNGYAEETVPYTVYVDKLTEIKEKIAALYANALTEEELHAEEELAKTMRDTTARIARVIDPMDSKLN